MMGCKPTPPFSIRARLSKSRPRLRARNKSHRARNFVLATGGILGGGLLAGYDGKVTETILQLPVSAPQNRSEWFGQEFLSASGHPIFQYRHLSKQQLQPAALSSQPGI